MRGGVLTVSNSNIGKGIKWNPITKQYEVNIGDGLEINEQGQIVGDPEKPDLDVFFTIKGIKA